MRYEKRERERERKKEREREEESGGERNVKIARERRVR